MKKLTCCTIAVSLAVLAACGDQSKKRELEAPQPPVPGPELAAEEEYVEQRCEPDAEERAAVQSVRVGLQEFMACGAMQAVTADSFALRVLLSDPKFVEESTRQELIEFMPSLAMPLVYEDGILSVRANGFVYELRVYEPFGSPLAVNPFTWGSYLDGLSIDQEYTFAEMLEAPDLLNRWTFTFDGPGPLAHLLNGGEPLTSPFEIEATLWDFALMMWDVVDWEVGPFTSLNQLWLASRLVYDQDRVTLRADNEPRSLWSLSDGAGLELRELNYTVRGQDAAATPNSVAYAEPGVVVGTMGLTFPGTARGMSGVVDFSTSRITYSCEDGENFETSFVVTVPPQRVD